ncbi:MULTISPECIES: helix-turn-helix domain-containing protein [unclassified Streptomyces]|uniref:helix-turn-helix domain-containing protein n=1 Tax=unclassified Streptomyces TaxID=2593676 RepID=UPI003D945B02
MAVNTAAVAARQRFGRELKRVREGTLRSGKRIQQIDVAKALGRETYHRYSQIERGTSWPKDDEWTTICKFLGMDAVTRATLSTMRSEGMSIASAWWTEYQDEFPESLIEFVAFEDAATRITTSGGGTIPGLLQTADYARALTGAVASSVMTRDQVERSVSIRRSRRGVLDGPQPATLEVIFSEAALRQEVGGRDVLLNQLDSLIEDYTTRKVICRVIPLTASATAVYTMHLLEFAGEGESPVAALDSMTGMLLRKTNREVRETRYYLDSMRSLSLSPAESQEMIQTIRKELARA